MSDTPLLAIIVPAYKARFLPQALASIAAQEDQRFRLYVCDDGSPENLSAIFDGVFPQRREDRRFIRFEKNLGGRSLIQQWNRCVAQTDGESWVWLFSDDDVADTRCVEQFHQTLDQNGLVGNVCRFNTAIINEKGTITEITPPHPPLESAEHFAYHRLCFHRRSFAPEYIFRRAAFETNGGFVEFPFALGSDDASWITFAGNLPMVTLPDAKVFWRWSGSNTSNLQGKECGAKILALAEFSAWMQRYFGSRSPDVGTSMPSEIRMDQIAKKWFFRITRQLPGNFGYIAATRVALELHQQHFAGIAEAVVKMWLAVFRGQAGSLVRRFKTLLFRADAT